MAGQYLHHIGVAKGQLIQLVLTHGSSFQPIFGFFFAGFAPVPTELQPV
jgi:hypothetical protein